MDDTLSIQIWWNAWAHKEALFRDLKGSLPSSRESEEHVFTGGILFWVLKIQENFKVSLGDGGHLFISFHASSKNCTDWQEKQVKPPLTCAFGILEDREHYTLQIHLIHVTLALRLKQKGGGGKSGRIIYLGDDRISSWIVVWATGGSYWILFITDKPNI